MPLAGCALPLQARLRYHGVEVRYIRALALTRDADLGDHGGLLRRLALVQRLDLVPGQQHLRRARESGACVNAQGRAGPRDAALQGRHVHRGALVATRSPGCARRSVARARGAGAGMLQLRLQ